MSTNIFLVLDIFFMFIMCLAIFFNDKHITRIENQLDRHEEKNARAEKENERVRQIVNGLAARMKEIDKEQKKEELLS